MNGHAMLCLFAAMLFAIGCTLFFQPKKANHGIEVDTFAAWVQRHTTMEDGQR